MVVPVRSKSIGRNDPSPPTNSPYQPNYRKPIDPITKDMIYRVIQNKDPPLPGRNKKYSMKTEDSIFKYNLFNNYLELFGSSAPTQYPFSKK